jgi:hypothetical protein
VACAAVLVMVAGCTTAVSAPSATTAVPPSSSAPPAPAPGPSASKAPPAVTPVVHPAAPSPYQQLRARVLGVFRARGAAAALADLGRAVRVRPAWSGVCHAVAHDLGHAALHALGTPGRALSVRDEVCGDGYTHGVVEMALMDSRHPARDLRAVCAQHEDGSCYHGVGHGVMFATHYDLPAALQLCDTAPDATLADRCGEGVFMQLFTLDDGAAHAAGAGYATPTPASARATCAATRHPYDLDCWFYSPTVLLQRHPEAWREVLAWCASAPTGRARSTCTKGVGSRLVKYHPDDIPFGGRTCAHASAALVDDCLTGMGSYWSVHWGGRRARSDVCHHLGDAALAVRCRSVLA